DPATAVQQLKLQSGRGLPARVVRFQDLVSCCPERRRWFDDRVKGQPPCSPSTAASTLPPRSLAFEPPSPPSPATAPGGRKMPISTASTGRFASVKRPSCVPSPWRSSVATEAAS